MLDTQNLKEIIKTPGALKNVLGKRPDWDSFFMAMTYLVSTRSSCTDRMVGAILVKNKTIIATGYNGAPRGIKDCLETGICIRENRDKNLGKDYHNCYAAHAEANALANHALLGGSSTDGATLYSSVYPCTDCVKLIINAGIAKIFYSEGFLNDTGLAEKMLKEAKIIIEKISKEKITAVLYKALEYAVDRDEKGETA